MIKNIKHHKTLLTISLSLLVLASSLFSYEIVIDKTLKIQSKYAYPALQRDDTKQIVYDPSSNLYWQDNSEAKSIKKEWEGAKQYCQNLSFGGYNDWYLPSIKELESIADYSKYPNAYKKGFKDFTSSSYWSSSASVSSSSNAWNVYFEYGYSSYSNKTNKRYVRCARAGQ
jgi:hypothetical protein